MHPFDSYIGLGRRMCRFSQHARRDIYACDLVSALSQFNGMSACATTYIKDAAAFWKLQFFNDKIHF
ncbi:hypothetical protein D3C74_502530 [compost metagenome]